MALNYLLSPTFQIENSAGRPATGGYLEVYLHGTRDKYYCASDFNGTLHPFQIPLDSLGSNIVLADDVQAYDVYAYNRYGSLLMSRYNVKPSSSGGSDSTSELQHWLGMNGPVYASYPGDGEGHALGIPINGPAGTGDVDYVGTFVDRVEDGKYIYLKQGLYLVNCIIGYEQDDTALSNTLDEVRVYTGYGNADESIAYQLDSSGPEATANRHNLRVSFVRHVAENEGGTLFFAPSTPVDWAEAYIQRLEIVKLNGSKDYYTAGTGIIIDSDGVISADFDAVQQKLVAGANITINGNTISATGGGGGASYTAGDGINITGDVISTNITAKNVSDTTQAPNFGESFSAAKSISSNGHEVELAADTIQLPTVIAGKGINVQNSNSPVGKTIAVDAGDGLGFDENNKLEVKVGTGLTIDTDGGVKVVTVDSDVSDVMDVVKKLEEDLDTQLCVNFDLANITNVYDFADGSVTGLTNGATMLCQAFAVPINHAIRVHGEDNPTMLGIYFKNASYTSKFILALYVYDFENGYTDYVGDTGPVQIYQQGLNQFALKTKNPNIDELSSRCIYYASLYLPSTKNSGLYLAGCESYSSAGNINAIPRFTIGVENIALNNTEIDLNNENATLSANDGQGNYYIGPWSDSYNERPSIPRFFMQIRNGEEPAIVTADPFTNIEYQSIVRNSNAVMSDVFDTSGLASATYPMVFQAVTPAVDVDIVSWTVYDGNADDSNSFYAKVYTSDFSDTVNTAATITDASGSYGYSHTVTPSTPIHLTAGTTYRWPVGLGAQNYYSALRTYDSSVTTTKVLHLFASSWDISNWVTYSRVNDGPAVALTLVDSDNNTWHI